MHQLLTPLCGLRFFSVIFFFLLLIIIVSGFHLFVIIIDLVVPNNLSEGSNLVIDIEYDLALSFDSNVRVLIR